MDLEQQLGKLQGQLGFMLFRSTRADMIIDELRKIVLPSTFDTIWQQVEGKIAFQHEDSITKSKSILLELNPDATPQEISRLHNLFFPGQN